MSESNDTRRENMYLALQLMMVELGEPYEWQEHDAEAPKFAAVMRTTWDELAERGLVHARSFDRYWLTGPGWIAGLKLTGLFEETAFREKAGTLQASLKTREEQQPAALGERQPDRAGARDRPFRVFRL